MIADPRYEKLAKQIVDYSIALQKGDRVLLDMMDAPEGFVVALMRAVRQAGAIPIVENRSSVVFRETLLGLNEEQARLLQSLEMYRMRKMQAYVAIRAGRNANETADVPSDRMSLYHRTMRPVLNYRVNRTRWVVLRWPTPSMAQSANMSTEAFEDFYFQVCCMDYARMARAMKPLIELMQQTDEVRIVGPGTDLKFSIKGMPAIPCAGLRNLPDGEVFTAPRKNSVNGVIQFNTPTIYAGRRFENIRLEFRNGKIVKATGSDTKRLNEILDTDPGARYVGEFAFGLNPYILEPMCDILFDEKICGSIHLTPGQAYEECDNKNRSAIHWDMVLIQRPEWGGGEIWFDGKLIRKDGQFVPRALQKLNPEFLREKRSSTKS